MLDSRGTKKKNHNKLEVKKWWNDGIKKENPCSHDGASMHIFVAKKGSDGLIGGHGDGVNGRGLEECMYI